MLEAMSHRVVLAESGQAALKQLTNDSFDLIFSDLAMPEMDGWETAREIRKRCPEIKIVLVTGYGPGTRPPTGEDDLVDAIIGKPFDFNQVSRTITEVTGNGKVLEKVGV
jgi:CheY-like chemotaxis protein